MLYKVRYLRQQYNLVVKNWFDISCQVCLSTPAFLRNHDVSVPLQTLVSVIFSKKYLKPDDILQSNWRLRELSLDKIMFATLDCFFVYKIANLITFPLPL
jgi:ribonuclease D